MSQAGTFLSTVLPPGTVVETLQGNTGGPISPNGANNIFVVGDGTTINVAGNPGTNTLTISATGITVLNYKNVNTSPYVVLVTDDYISVDCSGGPITIELPNAATIGKTFVVKDRTGSAAANNITITTVGGVVDIDGSTTYVMDSDYQSTSIIGNNSSYELY